MDFNSAKYECLEFHAKCGFILVALLICAKCNIIRLALENV